MIAAEDMDVVGPPSAPIEAPRRRPPPPPPPRRKRAKRHLTVMSREERASDSSWRRHHSRMLRSFLPLYATEVLRGPEEYRGRFLIGRHHIEWGEAINQDTRVLALAARDHGKSHFFCFAYPIWAADRRYPGKIGYIFSATEQQAIEHLDKIRKEIVGGGEHGGSNPKLAHLLPFKKDSKKTLRFSNGSEIRARGFGSKVRGGHPFWAVCDDVGNDEWIWSEGIRGKDVDYFLSAIEPMVVPGGQLIVVGTPFHAADLYYHLEESGEFRTSKHPALDEAGKPLWPARYPVAGLERRKRILGNTLRWSREYLCRPISDEASLFPSWLFDTPGVKQPYKLGLPTDYWRRMGMECYGGVDLAMSASAGGDYFVIFVMAYERKTANRWLVDIIRLKGLGFQDQLSTIINASKKYGLGLVFCESNQYQRVVTDEVVRTSDVPIKAFYTTGNVRKRATTERRGMQKTYSANKNALDQGVPALRMLLENGKLRIPWHPETRERVVTWINEMQAFGWADGKLQGVGSHDDTVVAMWICDQAVQVGSSFNLDWEEDEADPWEASAEPAENEPDFFGSRALEEEDWRPREGVGLNW